MQSGVWWFCVCACVCRGSYACEAPYLFVFICVYSSWVCDQMTTSFSSQLFEYTYFLTLGHLCWKICSGLYVRVKFYFLTIKKKQFRVWLKNYFFLLFINENQSINIRIFNCCFTDRISVLTVASKKEPVSQTNIEIEILWKSAGIFQR